MRGLARCIRTLVVGLAALAAVGSQPAQATLVVVATVLPLDASRFRWEISIENQAPDEGAIVSLVDAPLIKQDPQANLTDVYAFVGTRYENAAQRVLNVLVSVRPFSDPGDGVIYERFAA